jgi:hypothetical protein
VLEVGRRAGHWTARRRVHDADLHLQNRRGWTLIFFTFTVHFKCVLPTVMSGGELLELQLLDNQLVDTFCRKTTAPHKI